MSEYETTCNGPTCRARIIFSDVPTGKRCPYDYPVEPCGACGGEGSVEAVRVRSMFDGGGLETVQEQCAACTGVGKLYRSHYGSCPDADELRRRQTPVEEAR